MKALFYFGGQLLVVPWDSFFFKIRKNSKAWPGNIGIFMPKEDYLSVAHLPRFLCLEIVVPSCNKGRKKTSFRAYSSPLSLSFSAPIIHCLEQA